MSTILLADDNPHATRMGNEILSQEGHTVIAVPNGDAAMAYLSTNQPDIVLADVAMPGASGFAICSHIKANPALKHIKVVLLRGPLEPFDATMAKDVGSDGVLEKPLDAETLIRTIASLGDAQIEQSSPPTQEPHRAAEKHSTVHSDRMREMMRPVTSPLKVPALRSMPDLDPDVSNQFASVVEQALQTGLTQAEQRTRIRAAVRGVLESVTPLLLDTITERVMKALRED